MGATQSWGATRAQWAHFARTLGLHEDLLPVVSNPEAKISPQSSLRGLGKTPSRYNAQRQVVGIKEWTGVHATLAQCTQWSAVRDYGICLQTRRVRALDIDIDDAERVLEVLGRVAEHVPLVALRRRAGSPRVLVLFRCEGLLSKRVIAGPHGAIELLADGQQCVVAGTHIDREGRATAPYEWTGGLPESIPIVPRETLEVLWGALGGGVTLIRSPAREPGVLDLAPPEDPVEVWLDARDWMIERAYGVVRIVCPWRDDHSADSGPSETVYFPAGTGGYVQGHFQCVHAHCAHRTDADFLEAIGYRSALICDFADARDAENEKSSPPGGGSGKGDGAQGALPVADPDAREIDLTTYPLVRWNSSVPGEGLKRGKKGYQAAVENVARALDTPGFWRRLGYDTFRELLMSSSWNESLEKAQWSEVRDLTLVEGREALGFAGFEPVGRELMRDCVELVAHRRCFDAAQVWLSRLRWDGVLRVDEFLTQHYGAADRSYSRAVSRYLWTALAGRVLSPGVQADMVPILVGPQGVRKTRGVASLAPFPEAYVTVDLTLRDAELARRMRGRLVLELDELRGLHTREKGAIKSFITEPGDTWIPKYKEFATTMLRRAVFIGTSDTEEVLDDVAGNRRWLPISVAKFIELTAELRDQLWAEGAALFLAGGVAWQEAEQLAKKEHEEFRITDIWEDEINDWLQKRAENTPFRLRDLAIGIGLDPRQIKRADEMRLAKALKAIKYELIRVYDAEVGNTIRLWKSTS